MNVPKSFIYENIDFINFNCISSTQQNRPYIIRVMKSELKIKYNDFSLKKSLVLKRAPIAFNNLVFTFPMCSDQF